VPFGTGATAAPRHRLSSHGRSAEVVGGYAAWTLLAGLAVATGLYLRALDRRRTRAVGEARQAQRLELADDLHDFVVHDINEILLQSQAGRRMVTRCGVPRRADRKLHAGADQGQKPLPVFEGQGGDSPQFTVVLDGSFACRTRLTVMTAPLVFGVFPLGIAGGPDGVAVGPPDDFEAIGRAFRELQGEGRPLLPRMYVLWSGADSTAAVHAQIETLTAGGIPWDLVLCYRDPDGDVAAWTAFVTEVVQHHGRRLSAVQVTGEPNLTWAGAAADGAFPRAQAAMVQGVLAGAAAKRETGGSAAIGFAVVPEIDPATSGFWTGVRESGGSSFVAALDYAGLDIYPDVFGPRVSLDRLPGAVERLLRDFRERALPTAGIPVSVPIRISENGWPTGPDRPEHQQAAVLEAIIRTVHRLRAELNVTHWQLFTLRDADSSKDDLFHRFGVLRSDYSPKPAFHTLRRLIAEVG
jgi:hypothetical protein